MITHDDFKRFAKAARAHIAAGIVEHSGTMAEFGIDTPLRVAHFMAQIAHESASFRTTREYASGKAYEGRRDLGNTRTGDGVRFRGHGLIQVTGRHNHRAFTRWAQARYPDAPDFEAAPDTLMEFPWALLSAIWYWDSRNLNRLADKNDLRAITKKINGGYNGLSDRKVWFNRAWKIWGTGAAIRHAGKGKHPLKSTTNIAAATGAAAVTVAQVADTARQGRDIWDSVGSLFTFDDPLKTILVVAVIGLAAYIIWERVKKARELDI